MEVAHDKPTPFLARGSCIGTSKPLTGIWGEATCGGSFAVQLRKAGYDALVVEGAANSPVYINIMDGDVEIKDASELWGKMTLETELPWLMILD